MPDVGEMPFGSDLILAEMNHRWSNGLQLISAALWRYGERRAAGMDEQLVGLGNQVQAMAALHRRLSGPPLCEETFETHCRSLCREVAILSQQMKQPEGTVRFRA